MDKITEDNKLIAKTYVSAFGGKPEVSRYWDDNRTHYVDLLICHNQPQKNINCFGTIGTSDYPLHKDGIDTEIRVEFVGACGAKFENFGNVLATVAFCIINSRWFCYPGAIFPDVLKMYNASSTLKHIFFAPPFLWEAKLNTINLSEKKVTWLLIVPISEPEYIFAEKNGSDALEDAFVKHQIDIFNLNRPSIF